MKLPKEQKRPGGMATPVKGLFQMLGHEGGSNSPLPVQRLDHAMQKTGGKSTGKGQGISISGNVGDIKTNVSIPSIGAQKSALKKQMSGPANPPRNKK